ncbi:MAG: 4-(cytidine 5'-diphospho)-2-C-methyl-D-erythritol kinase [Deferrisomatales bacterium]|nr:4-(cytidine 5'-diphospho)-2-C-methyl-D-erythritol kinase [Deferrisomatales bacterium]
MNPARGLTLRAPAKVNLFLQVCGRRPDGYHDLRMFLAPVSLFDDVEVTLLHEDGRVEVSAEGAPEVPGGEGNLCHRAARFYLEETGVGGGARVRVVKRVPSGAGLGGGSSDAAVTLLGLERLHGRPLSPAGRARAAFAVGADVPFFFARGPAWVEGVGEVVRPAPPFEPLWLVLVHPGAFLSTARVFSRFTPGLTSPDTPHTIAQFNFPGFVRALRNDLAGAARALEPSVGEALEALEAAGASGSDMSGSGSAVFGLFPDEAGARRGASLLDPVAAGKGWRVHVASTLPPGAFPFVE